MPLARPRCWQRPLFRPAVVSAPVKRAFVTPRGEPAATPRTQMRHRNRRCASRQPCRQSPRARRGDHCISASTAGQRVRSPTRSCISRPAIRRADDYRTWRARWPHQCISRYRTGHRNSAGERPGVHHRPAVQCNSAHATDHEPGGQSCERHRRPTNASAATGQVSKPAGRWSVALRQRDSPHIRRPCSRPPRPPVRQRAPSATRQCRKAGLWHCPTRQAAARPRHRQPPSRCPPFQGAVVGRVAPSGLCSLHGGCRVTR